jgi:acyl CoA:acetate/3-ketoacid CoA transferase beta subunit
VLVEAVDVVSGVGYDRAAKAGLRFHDVHRVVTDLAVFDFGAPDRTMRLRSVHPGVDIADVVAQTSFPLRTDGVGRTREPTEQELHLLRTVLDPDGRRHRDVPG